MTNGSVFKYGTHLSVGTIPQPSGTIQFYSSDTVEVMRLSRDGVWANPDVPVDETAQAVLNALDYNIKLLVQRAVEAEREQCAKVCEELRDDWLRGLGRYEFMGEGADYCADAIRSRT